MSQPLGFFFGVGGGVGDNDSRECYGAFFFPLWHLTQITVAILALWRTGGSLLIKTNR